MGLPVFVNGKLVGIHNRVSTVLNARENGSYTEFFKRREGYGLELGYNYSQERIKSKALYEGLRTKPDRIAVGFCYVELGEPHPPRYAWSPFSLKRRRLVEGVSKYRMENLIHHAMRGPPSP